MYFLMIQREINTINHLGFKIVIPLRDSWEDELRIYKWPCIRQKVQCEKHWQQEYQFRYGEDDEMCDDDDDASDEEEEKRGSSFYEVVKSAFLPLFVMQVVGLSSLTAFMDRKVDSGYKIGYLISWILGGPGGVLLSILLSFANWICGDDINEEADVENKDEVTTDNGDKKIRHGVKRVMEPKIRFSLCLAELDSML